jgi:hypothetical protein
LGCIVPVGSGSSTTCLLQKSGRREDGRAAEAFHHQEIGVAGDEVVRTAYDRMPLILADEQIDGSRRLSAILRVG